MSDIVERLHRDKWHVTAVDCQEAADEITRLRDQLHLAEVARAAQVEGVVQAAAGWRERANQLEAERDAAFAISRCQCATDEACSELARLRQYLDAAQRRGEELRAQVAALEVDAGRYKYLRDVAWETGSLIFYAERYGPEDWDAHIDAALAARKGEA